MRLLAVVLVLSVLLAGCSATDPVDLGDEDAPPDPDEDLKGWEDGYWNNESLAVDADDGLNDTELAAVVSRAMARVELVRDVEFDERVDVSIDSRDQFRENRGDSEPPEALRTFDNGKFEALLLIGEENDSLAVQRRNREVSVGGFYSPSRNEIVVVADGETARIDETVLGHELVHAWQDRTYDLSRYDERVRDAANAEDGLIEGDADYVQHRYGQRCGSQWDCVDPSEDGNGGQLANYGVYFLKFFPYSDGPSFVSHQRSEGGWDAVDDLYGAPPESSEQVAHPEKYGQDDPTSIELADRTAEGWERVRPPNRPDYGTVGQAGVMAMLVYPTYHSEGETEIVPQSTWLNYTDDGEVSDFEPLNYDHPYAAGWDGDRLHVYRKGDEIAYVWRLVWDSPEDAAEFAEGYREVLDYWGARQVDRDTLVVDDGPFEDAFHVTVSGDTVTITNAPTVDELSAVGTTVSAAPNATVTPTPPTASPTPTSTDSPGFGPIVAVIALAVVGLGARRIAA
jgi:PGF-CTERM protein